jgi:Glutathione S-transferase, C-terminal domain
VWQRYFAIRIRCLSTVVLGASLEPVPQIPSLIERGKGRVGRFYRKFEDQLKDNQFVAGDRFTVADITTLCSVDFAKFVGLEMPQDYPSVARWHLTVSPGPKIPQVYRNPRIVNLSYISGDERNVATVTHGRPRDLVCLRQGDRSWFPANWDIG